MHGHDRHNTSILSIIHNVSTVLAKTCSWHVMCNWQYSCVMRSCPCIIVSLWSKDRSRANSWYLSLNAIVQQPTNWHLESIPRLSSKMLATTSDIAGTLFSWTYPAICYYCKIYLWYFLAQIVVLTPNGTYWIVCHFCKQRVICCVLHVCHVY